MEGKIEAAVVTFVMVIASIWFYVNFVKPYVGTSLQTQIGI